MVQVHLNWIIGIKPLVVIFVKKTSRHRKKSPERVEWGKKKQAITHTHIQKEHKLMSIIYKSDVQRCVYVHAYTHTEKLRLNN